ncbi:MAG: hypothetical protein R3F24_04785 [Gammaproteobacteria bacterium]
MSIHRRCFVRIAATLLWSTGDATDCTASGDWSGDRATTGAESTGPLTADRSYTLTCSGAGGSASASTFVTVQPAVQPTLSFEVVPGSVVAGSAATLNRTSSNATSCMASGAWNGSKALSGTQGTGAIASTSTYTLVCQGQNASSVKQSVTVTVVPPPPPPPAVTLSVSPQMIDSGQAATLSWSSSNATGCVASGGWSGNRNTVGTETTGPLTSNAATP